MAKRKRLNPATATSVPDAPLETKAMHGWVGVRPRPPIADVAGDSAAQSAFEEVAEELRAARAEGRMVLSLPLSAIDAGHLVRDRVGLDPDEMATLKSSLVARGQQTPIEVIDLGGGQFGLISGWRRYTALRELAEEGGQDAPQILALVRAPDSAAEAYKAMVEENEIRTDLSFYERARIAVKAVEQGLYSDAKEAVQSLFSAARPAKRSKILNFVGIVEALDGDLRFPAVIPEKLGLPLAAALLAAPGRVQALRKALRQADPQDATAERAVLAQVLKDAPSSPRPAKERETVAPGIVLEAGQGRAVLSGPGVDAALVARLRQFLLTQNR